MPVKLIEIEISKMQRYSEKRVKGREKERDRRRERLLMLCQYCLTVMPIEGIEIDIEREGERSQNPKGRKSPYGER